MLGRGGNVFRGYLSDPTRTAEALDADGWLHTGDIGTIDDDGYLRIVDRKKELIITAGGKNISPANIEAALKAEPLIGQACVIGDGRPHLVALIVPDPDVVGTWAASEGIAGSTLGELAAHPGVRAELAREVASANRRFSGVEQVRNFAVVDHEWLPDSDELTPTMKLKRKPIAAQVRRRDRRPLRRRRLISNLRRCGAILARMRRQFGEVGQSVGSGEAATATWSRSWPSARAASSAFPARDTSSSASSAWVG